jgi:hypothetical protein
MVLSFNSYGLSHSDTIISSNIILSKEAKAMPIFKLEISSIWDYLGQLCESEDFK